MQFAAISAFAGPGLTLLPTMLAGKRVTELRFSDRMVRYESATMRELMALRETIQRELSQTSPKQRRFVVRHAGKGVF